jgi:hypothetical protein
MAAPPPGTAASEAASSGAVVGDQIRPPGHPPLNGAC